MATVIDVARHAGVSSATVSRVLNGHLSVSEEVRERVLAAAKELDFYPNPMAQALRRGQASTVALLAGDIEQTYYSALTKHVQETLDGIGVDLLLYNLAHSEIRLRGLLQRAVAMRLRGVVIAASDKFSASVRPLFQHLEANGIFVLSIGQDLSRHGIPSIVHEERAAAARSVRHLLDQRRAPIAYVGRIEGSVTGTERFRGYKMALKQAGVPFREDLVWDVTFRYAAGHDAVCRALDKGIRIRGLQAGSDELAMGAIAALLDRNIRVPDEVAVVGFGNTEFSAHIRPSLTTLSSHPELVAEHIREILQSLERGASAPLLTSVRRSLVIRQSA